MNTTFASPPEVARRSVTRQGIVFSVLLLAVTGFPCLRASAAEAPLPATNYLARPGDLLRFSVYLEPELDQQVRVEADGTVILPLVGTVAAAGRTMEKLREELTSRFDTFLVDPQVTVQVVAFASRAVHVIGQVNRPGTIGMPGDTPLTLLDAISAAGGFTRRADVKKVSIRRREEGGHRIIEKNVAELLSEPEANDVELYDGDTIVVGERWI